MMFKWVLTAGLAALLGVAASAQQSDDRFACEANWAVWGEENGSPPV
jgi:hypothetical protein